MKTMLYAAVLFFAMTCMVINCGVDTEDDGNAIDGFEWIRAGAFMMGSPFEEPGREGNENPHRVILSKGFYMGKYAVTEEQFAAVDLSIPVAGSLPKVSVSWNEIIMFCNTLSIKDGLSPAYRVKGSTDPAEWGSFTAAEVMIITNANGYRLPTEAQWEYACRAGTTTAYSFGNTITPDLANYFAMYGNVRLPVDSFSPNAWGLYNMHGNVWEVVWDLYRDGSSYVEENIDPMGETGGTWHLLRGGSWEGAARQVRSASRLAWNPPGGNIGFRLARLK